MLNKIMQELMKEKRQHNLPLEKLLGEESKVRRPENQDRVCNYDSIFL